MFALGEQAWGSVTSPYEMDEERDEIELESENERTDREATTDEFDEDEWDKSGCWLVTSGRVLLFVMFVWLVTLQVCKVRDWLSGMNVDDMNFFSRSFVAGFVGGVAFSDGLVTLDEELDVLEELQRGESN